MIRGTWRCTHRAATWEYEASRKEEGIQTTTADHVHPGCNLGIDSEATTHGLLNEATEWLQYSRRMGLQCAAHAHARVSWEKGAHIR
jgi:hypothetical protein